MFFSYFVSYFVFIFSSSSTSCFIIHIHYIRRELRQYIVSAQKYKSANRSKLYYFLLNPPRAVWTRIIHLSSIWKSSSCWPFCELSTTSHTRLRQIYVRRYSPSIQRARRRRKERRRTNIKMKAAFETVNKPFRLKALKILNSLVRLFFARYKQIL